MKYSAVVAAPVVLALASQDPGVAALKLTVISPTQPLQLTGSTGNGKATGSSFLQSVLRCAGICDLRNKDGGSENSAPTFDEFVTGGDITLKQDANKSIAKAAIKDGLTKLEKHMLFSNGSSEGVYDVLARYRVLEAITENFNLSGRGIQYLEQYEYVGRSRMTPNGKTAGELANEADEIVATAARDILEKLER